MEIQRPNDELYLDFNLENISIVTLAEITKILNKCSSLVNDDILNIADEIINRFSSNTVPNDKEILLSVKYIYNALEGIPWSHERRETIYNYYSTFIKPSPTVSPVKTPRKYVSDPLKVSKVPIPFMKKCKPSRAIKKIQTLKN
jgi:hypothetical protein